MHRTLERVHPVAACLACRAYHVGEQPHLMRAALGKREALREAIREARREALREGKGTLA